MGIKIHLGVNDIPYGAALATAPRRAGTQPSAAAHASRVSTGDVAQFIEARYHLLERFAEMRRQRIEEIVLQAMNDKLERVSGGRSSASSPLLDTTDLGDIAEEFRKMLDERAFDGEVTGVPTAAAQAGVNHRLMRPYVRSNPSRPSFIDTGLYQANFRAWSD